MPAIKIACVCVRVCVYMSVYEHICVYMSVYERICVYMNVYECVCLYFITDQTPSYVL